jgi:hypothetical protein
MPLVVPAVSRLGNDEPESVVQDTRCVDPEPCAPPGITNAEWVIGNVTVWMGHGLRIGRAHIAQRSLMSPETSGQRPNRIWIALAVQ